MKKAVYSIGALFLVLTFLVGCAAPAAPSAPAAPPATAEPTPAAAPTEAPAAAPAAKEPVTITYMASQGWITTWTA